MPFGAFGRVPEDQPCCEPTCEQPCPLGTGTHCGSVYAMQTMLGVLGFLHPLDETSIDGRNGPKTRGAVAAYALAKGIPVDPNKPSGLFCVALIADYNAYVDPGPGATDPNECAPGQWGAPPFCFGQPSSVPPPPQGGWRLPPSHRGAPALLRDVARRRGSPRATGRLGVSTRHPRTTPCIVSAYLVASLPPRLPGLRQSPPQGQSPQGQSPRDPSPPQDPRPRPQVPCPQKGSGKAGATERRRYC